MKWLATTEFAFNNKIYISMKPLPFKFNYKRESRMNFKIRKKKKHVKVEEFVKEMKKMHEKVKVALRKL